MKDSLVEDSNRLVLKGDTSCMPSWHLLALMVGDTLCTIENHTLNHIIILIAPFYDPNKEATLLSTCKHHNYF